MGAIIPNHLKETNDNRYLAKMGLGLTFQGKTRDIYDLGGNLLIIASDRLSIFEFVLSTAVPFKGEVLTALVHFWMTKVLFNYPHHLLESTITPGLNAVHDLKTIYPDLPMKRSLVVKKVNILPYELILRHHIGGSVYKNYLTTGMAGGQKLTPNLPKWSKLDNPIFTPSTKEETGHDINIDADYFFKQYGERGYKLVLLYQQAFKLAYAYAENRGILILDTKLEGDFFLLADEVLTPDSSRFCDVNNWREAMRLNIEPAFLDKQVVRAWGETVVTPFEKDGEKIIGLKGLDPEKAEHIEWVHALKVPDEIIKETTRRYIEIFERLTGVSLKAYQKHEMKI